MDPRLPGNLTRWRGRWLVWRHRPRMTLPAVPVNHADHAELLDLVRDAAKLAEAEPPALVGLGGPATVVNQGATLVIGLPLVLALDTDDLRTVVAHELALPATDHRKLVHDLLALPRTAELSRVAERVEQARDAAAIAAVGGGFAAVSDAALALLRAEAVRLHFRRFVAEFGTFAGDPPSRVLDVHEFWLHHRRLNPSPLPLPGPGFAEIHPGLTPELLDLIEAGDRTILASPGTPVSIDLHVDEETLRQLTLDAEPTSPAEAAVNAASTAKAPSPTKALSPTPAPSPGAAAGPTAATHSAQAPNPATSSGATTPTVGRQTSRSVPRQVGSGLAPADDAPAPARSRPGRQAAADPADSAPNRGQRLVNPQHPTSRRTGPEPGSGAQPEATSAPEPRTEPATRAEPATQANSVLPTDAGPPAGSTSPARSRSKPQPDKSRPGAVRWVRGTDLPTEVYAAAVRDRARLIIEAVQTLLGGPPSDRDELAETVLRRPVPICRAAPELGPSDGPRLLADVLEYTLLRRGWVRIHAALPSHLTGPDGETLNLTALLDRPQALRAILLRDT